MGWVAAGGATLVTAGFIYTLFTKNVSAATKVEERAPHIQNNRDKKTSQILGECEPAESKNQTPSFSLPPNNILPQRDADAPSPPAPIAIPPARSSSPPRLKPPAFSSMPAPPRPNSGMTALRPPPSTASSLRVPTTKVLPNTSMAPSSLMPPSKKASRQVILKPGHSPLDWAMLTSKPNHHLRGKDVPDSLIRVSPSQLKYHNGRKGRDAWTVYQGKVYNVTAYLPFHPGGEGELMRGAGKDSGKLFMEVHPWVNWDGMLGECLVGILFGEGEEKDVPNSTSGELDEMD